LRRKNEQRKVMTRQGSVPGARDPTRRGSLKEVQQSTLSNFEDTESGTTTIQADPPPQITKDVQRVRSAEL